MKTTFPALLTALLLAYSAAAHAGDVYKWTDPATGTVQFGDKVPPQFEKSAVKVTPREPNSAQDRSLEEKARTWRDDQIKGTARAAAPARAPAAAPAEAPKPPSRAERLAAYRNSQECFEQFRNANATMRPEAFQYCNEVKDPNGEQVRPAKP